MIPEELRTAIEETEDAENDIIRRPRHHHQPQHPARPREDSPDSAHR